MTRKPFDFKRWYLAMPMDARERYAERAGTTAYYIAKQLVGRRKLPRAGLMAKLADASQGQFTRNDLLGFFYGPDSGLSARAPRRGRASPAPASA